MLRRAMLSELPIVSRKWRKYATYVVQRPQLSADEREKFEEQQKRREQGADIPAEELIREPEAYEERLYKLDEFETEGHALEEFMLSLVEYQDIVKVKAERWKEQIGSFQDQISNGEEVIAQLRDKVAGNVEFWEQVKLNKPGAQLTALIQAKTAGAENPRFLEFCCKCARRAIEMNDFANLADLEKQIADGVKAPEEDEAAIETKKNERLEYLNKDIIRKQRKRFAALEERVKHMLEQQSLSGGNATMGTKRLQQLVSGDKVVSEEDGEGQLLAIDSREEQASKFYAWLWISEKYLLVGLCKFLGLSKASPQRSLLQIPGQNCVFNDIYQIDFTKYKHLVEDFAEGQRRARARFEEDHKEDQEVYAPSPEARVRDLSALIEVMASAAEYAKHSRSWLQLISILRFTWNILAFDLTTPLELTQVDGWRHILLLAESTLCLLEYLQRGGSLRQVANRSIDKVPNQQPSFDKDGQARTVAFSFEGEAPAQDAVGQTGEPAETRVGQAGSGKGSKWFEQIDDFEITMHASFISFAVQCLMAVSKWESLVDISNRLNNATENEFAPQLLPFIIFAQSTLHEQAAARTAEKRRALETRI